MAQRHLPALLIIMDGCGLAPADGENAVAAAKTPFLDSLYEKYPHTTLGASGEDVGLPDGQMGNSEVGHLNIGAGRIVFQELSRINNAIKDGSIAKNEVFVKAMDDVKADGKTLHLMGLMSPGGVHSHMNHVEALVKMAAELGRATRPDLKLGICGEHGGDPASVEFCHKVGLNYVSCSPYRVPIARLAAAQAAIREQRQ